MSLFDCQTTEISDSKFQIKTRNSSSAILDEASKLQPSKPGRRKMSTSASLCHLQGLKFRLAPIGNHQSFQISNLRSEDRKVGGGEGIRTPDPRVANAVLCQLSYAPDSLPTANFRLPIDRRLRLTKLAIGNRQLAIAK